MKVTLIHPPLDDPTIPYHATSYLAGSLAEKGFTDVAVRDFNVAFVNWCFQKEVIDWFRAQGEARLSELSAKSSLSFIEQDEFYRLWTAKMPDADLLQGALTLMRDKQAFLDWDNYRESANAVNHYFSFLGALSYPCEIYNFRLNSRGRFSLYNSDDLFNEELSDRICFPMQRWLHECVATDPGLQASDLIGVSIVYDHQIAYALNMVRFMRRLWPEKKIVIGGTAFSSYYKNLKNPVLFERLLELCDGVVVGEGETAICEILECGAEFSGRKIRNLVYFDHERGEMVKPASIYYENVPKLGRPRYSYDWDLYLSPVRAINYSPTRGCYWNRCTFCDYGLNTDKPTSPWRETPVEKVVAELKEICEREQVQFVYFAVDVMAPRYIEQLADAIIDAKLDIRWAAEMRMEKVFSKKRCERLAQSGAVCISFGMESGNQRVLDLIDKGTKVTYMQETMRNFAEAGVAVQLMAFTGFPGEQGSERRETLQFIRQNQDYWATGALESFVLTGKAIVARNPGKFGIRLREIKDLDAEIYVAYEMEDSNQVHRTTFQESLDSEHESTRGLLPIVFSRPWAGSTDTLHSMLYYDAFGRDFFKQHSGLAELDTDQPKQGDGLLKLSPFDIEKMARHSDAFEAAVQRMRSDALEPTYPRLCAYNAAQPPLERIGEASYWIEYKERLVRLGKVIYKIAQHREVS